MKEECLICRAPLEYLLREESMECAICHRREQSKTRCVEGHYVCSDCHTQGMDSIFGLCLAETSTDPIEIIRKMMDMPIANWTVPVKTMGDSPTFCPVNIENAKELLACVEESGAEVFAVAASNQEGTNGLSAKKTGVGDELASEFENYVDQITFMYRIDPEVYSESVNDIMLIAMYQGTEQGIVQEAYSDCYDQVMAALQENIDKE